MHNNKLENFVNEHREEFDSLSPNTDILNRIQAQMQKKKGEMHESSSTVYRLPSTVYRWAAAAVVIGLVGIGVYKTIDRRPETGESSISNLQSSVAKIEEPKMNKDTTVYRPPSTVSARISQPESRIPSAVEASPTQGGALRSSVSGLPSTVSLRLTNMESASDRYAAVSEIMEMKKIDRDIIDVLVKTMNNDPNSNVRLAAMESLGKYYREPYVKKQLVQSMSIQKDPVIQIALIEMLSKFRNTSIAKELKKIAEDGNTTKPVKDQAYSSLLKYSL
jgi:hypothetical protein